MARCRTQAGPRFSLPFPFFTVNLFDPIIGDVLGTLQTLARAAGCLTLPHLTRRVPYCPRQAHIPTMRTRQAPSVLRSPISGDSHSIWAGGGVGGAAPQPPRLNSSQRNLS